MAGPFLVISIRTLLEYSLDPTAKNAAGHVQSFNRLFQPDALARLDFEHRGVYALLLFHPTADPAIAEYVNGSGALASDSGPRIMVLFTLGVPARAPVALPAGSRDPWMELDRDVHPSYAILRSLFTPKAPPAIPGILFLSSLDVDEESVYVPLAGLQDSSEARHRIATAFSVADQAIGEELRPKRFADDLSVALLRAQVPYVRSDRASTREFLIRAFRVVSRHRGDIATAVNLGMGKP
ncbi:hypothetical protein QQY66_46800 [Streptomyces sp. DG2A-72]|uniref:hypothetical protein n=1 Tax=Streptomyces sp. DG2A-72 TaxID=3051386 RepID=UPI00265C8B41|nr:hypothetical protein [Streptomyces sp. DG2A-72]MDO0938866.1 hypothetical protein [Streptomyces sp. DG2A-72]